MADRKKPGDAKKPKLVLVHHDDEPVVAEKKKKGAPPPEPAKPARMLLADRLTERDPDPSQVSDRVLKIHTRRDFLLFGAGAVAAAAGFWWLLPEDVQFNLLHPHAPAGASAPPPSPGKERFLNGALAFDDDVAKGLYSPHRLVPTYSKFQVTPNLINNYNGQTPDAGYLDDWMLTIEGLETGKTEKLSIRDLQARFEHHEQITRLVCVEGWSAITWWGGLRFADLLAAYRPMPGARWARLDSSVNLDSDGNPDPYYVSIDLATARHPQTLLATHHNGARLSVDHGAPLRLVAPMKLGLKNIKAITKITYSLLEPADYWAERGYSKYDGL